MKTQIPSELPAYHFEKGDLRSFLNKQIKVSYNSLIDEIARDEGLLLRCSSDFVTIQTFDGRIKFIGTSKIVRIEVME